MEVNRPLIIGVAVALAAIVGAFFAGRSSVTVRVETRTEVVERLQVVRLVRVDRRVDTKWKTVVVTKPDGSSTSTTEAESTEVAKSTEDSKIDSKTDTAVVTIKTPTDKNWHVAGHVGLMAASPINSAGSIAPVFGVVVSRRILGPVWVDVFAYSNSLVGAGVGLQF